MCRIVTAGGGNVVRYYKTLESLAAKLPGPREITHVFLDPGPKVIKSAELESLFESRAAASSTDQYSPLLTEESSYLMLVCRSSSRFMGTSSDDGGTHSLDPHLCHNVDLDARFQYNFLPINTKMGCYSKLLPDPP